MNKKIKQKFILVVGNNFKELNELLEDSWIIEKFHSHVSGQSKCYVLLCKEVYE
jgi:hypothetical protein